MQPEVRLRTEQADPERLRPGKLRHVRRPADVRAPRRSRRRAPGDRRPADLRRTTRCGWSTTTTATCAPGEVGELCCRGPYTLRGYYGVPEYNARAVHARTASTARGDLMRQHPSGNYMVEGRKKDLINRGGEKISAEEIENLILSHPAVQNVACIAVPDPDLGERMCACVILRDGASADVRRSCDVPDRTRRSPSTNCPSGWRSWRTSRSRPSARSRRRGGLSKMASAAAASAAKRQRHAHHRPALLSEHRAEWIALPAAVRRRAGEVLESPWTGEAGRRSRRRNSPTPASRRCWSRSIWRPRSRTPPCSNDYVTAMQKRHPERIIQAWGAVDPFKGEAAIQRGQARDHRSRHAGLPFPSDHGPLRGQRPRALSAVRDDRRAEGAGDDRRRHDRHGRRHARRHGREDPPRASLGDRRTGRRFPESHDHRGASRAGRGSTR